MLRARKRCVTGRLRRMWRRFLDLARAGLLPESARWILGSDVMFLEKPGKPAPRPIRKGETLAKDVAKSLIRDHKVKI